MKRILTGKMMGLAVAMVSLVALIAMATSATGAYFSDSVDGSYAGDGGNVAVIAGSNSDLGGSLNFHWNNMLPGEVYSATAFYRNDGDVPQDVWVVFPNRTALSALNSLGAYGAVQVADSSSGQVFYSNNLIDHPHDPQGVPGPDGRGILRKLPQMIKLRGNVAPGSDGAMTFKFQYASKLGNAANGSNFAFNTYPAPYTGGPTQDLVAGTDQVTVIPGEVGTGLPFQIVATQVGIEPNAAGGWAGF